jgi:hypothetical protein
MGAGTISGEQRTKVGDGAIGSTAGKIDRGHVL